MLLMKLAQSQQCQNSEVILAEYKSNGYNLSSAISVVNDRITKDSWRKVKYRTDKENNELEEKSIQQVNEALGQPVNRRKMSLF